MVIITLDTPIATHSKLTFKVARNKKLLLQLPYEQGNDGSEHEMRSHKLLEIRFSLWPGAEKMNNRHPKAPFGC